MEQTYPSINNLFNPTKKIINEYAVQVVQSMNGNYQHLDDISASLDITEEEPEISSQDIFQKFLLLIVQLAANAVDPTWKMPWFMVGPLTPVGVLAKLMSQKDEPKDPEPLDVTKQSDPCDV